LDFFNRMEHNKTLEPIYSAANMNKENATGLQRVLDLPFDGRAEIRFERTGNTVQVHHSSFSSPVDHDTGHFWWHACSVLDCLGEARAVGQPCIRHLDNASRAVYLADASKQQRLSLRGVEISQALWEEIRKSPVFAGDVAYASILFSGAKITAEIRLSEVDFRSEVIFFGATILAVIEMKSCIFRGLFDARYVLFRGAPASFFDSKFESTVDISYSQSDQSVQFSGATFKETLTCDGTAETIHFTTAKILGHLSFKYATGWLLLNGVALDGNLDLSNADLSAFHGDQMIISQASLFGPCRIKNLRLPKATFGARIRMDVQAEEIHLSNATFKEGGRLVFDIGTVNLHQLVLGGPLSVSGRLPGTKAPEVIGLLNADVGKMSFARVDLSKCSLYGAHGLGTVDIESTVSFPKCPWWAARRRYIADEWAWREANPSKLRPFRWRLPGVRIGNEHARPIKGQRPLVWLPSLHASQIAGTYRELRRSLESKSDMPGASDFYYGEMEMRRRDKDSSLWDRALVSCYWLLSGYGLRTERPVVAYVVLVCWATWAMMAFDGFSKDIYSIRRAAIFSVRASLPGFNTLETLTRNGQIIEIVVRALGALLAALFLLSLRTRLTRKPSD